VKAFYERAAADDYAGAWALAGPGFRTQLGGFESFRAGVRTLESVEFRRADTVSRTADSARVAIDTVATHTGRIDRCGGTLDLKPGGATAWLISDAQIACSSGRGGDAGDGAAAGTGHGAAAGPADAAARPGAAARSAPGSTTSAAGDSAIGVRQRGKGPGRGKRGDDGDDD